MLDGILPAVRTTTRPNSTRGSLDAFAMGDLFFRKFGNDEGTAQTYKGTH